MKKIGLFVIALITNASLNANPIELDLKIAKLVLPFQETQVAYLYDIKKQVSLAGLETPIIVSNSGKNRLVIGAALEEGEDMDDPFAYIGGDTQISDKYFGERFNVGAWIGPDFDIEGEFKDKLRGGIKASIKLWGPK